MDCRLDLSRPRAKAAQSPSAGMRGVPAGRRGGGVMAGRPTKKTPAVEKRILQALKNGNTRTAAAGAGGITKETFYTWMADFSDFSDAIKKAEAEAEGAHVAIVRQAGVDGQWQASAWWLERRRNEAWGRKDLLANKLGRMTDDELRDIIARENPGLAAAVLNGTGVAPGAAEDGRDTD